MNVIKESRKALKGVNEDQIQTTVERLASARDDGQTVWCVGNGGGAAHAMHFAADLRKIAKVRAQSFDSIPEMTARINDDGWIHAWIDWAQGMGRDIYDPFFVFSCGGGKDGVSGNLAGNWGIVGANGGGGQRIVIPSTSTPVIEGCQSVIAHHIVERLCS